MTGEKRFLTDDDLSRLRNTSTILHQQPLLIFAEGESWIAKDDWLNY